MKCSASSSRLLCVHLQAVPFPLGDKRAAMEAIQVLIKVGETAKLQRTGFDVTLAADGKLIKLHSWRCVYHLRDL
jgi:hypothetical protein